MTTKNDDMPEDYGHPEAAIAWAVIATIIFVGLLCILAVLELPHP